MLETKTLAVAPKARAKTLLRVAVGSFHSKITNKTLPTNDDAPAGWRIIVYIGVYIP